MKSGILEELNRISMDQVAEISMLEPTISEVRTKERKLSAFS